MAGSSGSIPRWGGFGIGLALTLLAAPAGAAGLAQRAIPSVEQRFAFGIDGVRAMQLELVGGGAKWRLTPTLDLSTMALATITAGSAEIGEPGRAGYGGELTLRLRPWPELAVQPFAYSSIGLLLFPRQRFLPGADVYEGVLSSGLGLEAPLGPRLTLGVKAFTIHLSNGQGLGSHNPAYDGFGWGLELGYALEPLEPLQSAPEAPSRRYPLPIGLMLDVQGGGIDDAAWYGARVRAPWTVAPGLLVSVDVEGGSLAEHRVLEAGAAAVWHSRPATLGFHGGYRRYVGFDIAVAAAQAEAHITRETSLIALGNFERASELPDTWRFGVGARFFPTPNLALDLGIGFDRLGEHRFDDDHSDPFFDVEWALPFGDRALCSLFIERQISGLNLLGVRAAFDAGRTLEETDRRRAWRRLR